MELKTYTRRPFSVEATEITAENISEIAPYIGKLQEKDGVPFILIDRKIVPSISRAYIGWFVTKMDTNYRCYSPKIFNEQFISSDG